MSMRTLFIIILFNISLLVNAQQVIGTSGFYFENNSISLSGTIGEIAIETYESPVILLTQGFQQPNLFITGINEAETMHLNMQVYPNPTSGHITLSLTKLPDRQAFYRLSDYTGKALKVEEINDTHTLINFQNLPSSVYFIIVYDKSGQLNSFKIIKQ